VITRCLQSRLLKVISQALPSSGGPVNLERGLSEEPAQQQGFKTSNARPTNPHLSHLAPISPQAPNGLKTIQLQVDQAQALNQGEAGWAVDETLIFHQMVTSFYPKPRIQ
jgi:hypothetical protein